MFGEPVTSCNIRVPVSSNPKYCSVSRFSKTDSRSRKRTKTWAGVAARSVNETIGTVLQGNPGTHVHRAREDAPAKHSTGDWRASLRAYSQAQLKKLRVRLPEATRKNSY